MKTVLHIPPEIAENVQLNLLLEIGQKGISLFWYQNQPYKIEGLSVFVFDEYENISAAISEILSMKHVSNPVFGKVSVCLNFSESILVPGKYYNEELNENMLSLQFGETLNNVVHSETPKNFSVHHIYRYSQEINSLIEKTFPQAVIIHSTTLQVSGKNQSDMLSCIVFYDTLKLILFRSGELQFVQQFSFKSPEDAVYHLLNTCQQYELDPETIGVRLSGMIVRDSLLFQNLYNYFMDIDFAEPDLKFEVSDNLSNLPAQFLHHLTELSLCV